MGKKKLKWTKPQVDAIERSIVDWAEITKGKLDEMEHGCACCDRYAVRKKDGGECNSCPVKLYTGKVECHNTPYYKFMHSFDYMFRDHIVKTKKQKESAQAELTFLKEVLAAGVSK